MENILYESIYGEGIMNLNNSPLRIIDKDRVSTMIPSCFKYFSPLLANICGSISAYDDIQIITPDCSGSTILNLYELVSSGSIKQSINNQCLRSIEENINKNILLVDKLIEAGRIFDVTICREAVSCEVKTDKLDCTASLDNVEQFLNLSENPKVEVESAFKEANLDNKRTPNDSSERRKNLTEVKEVEINMADKKILSVDSDKQNEKTFTLQDCNRSKMSIKIASFAKWPSAVPNLVSTTDHIGQGQNAVGVNNYVSNAFLNRDHFTRESESKMFIDVRKCRDCSFACSGQKKMKEHHIKKHNKILCEECIYYREFKSSRDLRNHKEWVHAHFRCTICGLNGQGLTTFRIHMKDVHGVIPYMLKPHLLKSALI